MQGSVGYNLAFAAAVCLVCAVVVSSSAVALADRQDRNAALDKQKNVLLAAGFATDDENLTADEVAARFAPMTQVVVDLASGAVVDDVDPVGFDQRAAASDPSRSRVAPENLARVMRLPSTVLVYEVRDAKDALQMVVLPVEGLGLWGTLYGFVALDGDLRTVRGLTFYEHKETPGAWWRGGQPPLEGVVGRAARVRRYADPGHRGGQGPGGHGGRRPPCGRRVEWRHDNEPRRHQPVAVLAGAGRVRTISHTAARRGGRLGRHEGRNKVAARAVEPRVRTDVQDT